MSNYNEQLSPSAPLPHHDLEAGPGDQVYVVEFDRDALYKYMCGKCCVILPVFSMCLCLPCLPLIPCWARKTVASIKCKITDKRIEFEGGWLNHISKQIPLDRVQDVSIGQSCCDRYFDVKGLSIQTAANSMGGPELILPAPRNAEMIRDLILERRDHLVLGTGAGGEHYAHRRPMASSKTTAVPEATLVSVPSSDPRVLELQALKAAAERLETQLHEGHTKYDTAA